MSNPNPSPLTRFVPGKSGNPSGRPKKLPITKAYESFLESKATALQFTGDESVLEAAAKSMLQQFVMGNVKAATEVTDRIEGKLKPPETQIDAQNRFEITVRHIGLRDSSPAETD